MASAAVVVGVDGYRQRPLTSAVRDAETFADLLPRLGLVEASQIDLITSPPQPGGPPATSDAIVDALYEIYRQDEALDRFVFFYAGHGILAATDAAGSSSRTALVPVDAENLERDGRRLIDFTDLLDRMRQAGPREQLYFVDACRDMPYERHPDVGRLGWASQGQAYARAQAAIYAVSPRGKAEGRVDGLGVMTGHLLEALDGEGIALDYDAARDIFVVTMRSAHAYVKERARAALEGQPAYRMRYQVPELVARGPECAPLVERTQVPARPLAVHIEPESAAPLTRVSISLGRVPLQDCGFPPRSNHDVLDLPPHQYLVTAESTAGPADPARDVVDVRKVSETTIRIGAGGGAPHHRGLDLGPVSDATGAIGTEPEPAAGEEEGVLRAMRAPESGAPGALPREPGEGRGLLHLEALEPEVSIEVEESGPPYRRWSGAFRMTLPLEPGPYRVRFRLGSDLFHDVPVMVEGGRAQEVRPPAELSPLLREALGTGDERPDEEWVSESIGPMQAAILDTTLAIVGVKPFDTRRELFGRFHGLVELRDPTELGGRPLSLVVAVDGDGWVEPPPQILEAMECRVAARPGDLSDAAPRAVAPLPGTRLGGATEDGPGAYGFERVGVVLAAPPAPNYAVRLESPVVGTIDLVAAALDDRATVLVLLLRPDGSTRVAQYLFRLPALRDAADFPFRGVSYGTYVRQLVLGQRLYEGGELLARGLEEIEVGQDGGDNERLRQLRILRDMLYGGWTDPLLSAMAFYAWERGRVDGLEEGADPGDEPMRRIAEKLWEHFGGVPDSRIVHAAAHPDRRDDLFAELLERDEVPLLAESARRLGRFAEGVGRGDAAVADVARRISGGGVWSVVTS